MVSKHELTVSLNYQMSLSKVKIISMLIIVADSGSIITVLIEIINYLLRDLNKLLTFVNEIRLTI